MAFAAPRQPIPGYHNDRGSQAKVHSTSRRYTLSLEVFTEGEGGMEQEDQ